MKLGKFYVLPDIVTAIDCGVPEPVFDAHIKGKKVRPLATSGNDRVVCTDAAGQLFYVDRKFLKG